MPKEVLIYGSIDSWSASNFIREINEGLEKDENAEIVVRLNTPGGDVDYAWGAVAKFAELKNKKTVKVDGKAHSMGLYYCCYTDEVYALDVSEFLLHRAAYPSWIENNPDYFTADRQASLARMNKKLRAAFEGKVDVKLFEQITGVTLDEVYSMDGQLDVRLTAQQAKRIGLIKSYSVITPSKKAEIESLMFEITAKHNGFEIAIAAKTDISKPTKKTMTLAELKAEHPALYAEVVALAATAAATEATAKERERIEAWAHFYSVDEKAVKDGIASGKAMTQLQIIELSEKKASKKVVKDIETDSTDTVATGEADKAKTAAEKELAEFVSGVKENSQVLKEAAAAKK